MTDHDANLTPDERAEADRQAVAEVIEKARIALVTTVDKDGSLVSRPLAVQSRTFDGDLYFFTPDPSDKTEQVRLNPAANVAIETGGNYLSIAGTASVVKDRELIDELWNAGAEAWFEAGRDDPTVALLKVHADLGRVAVGRLAEGGRGGEVREGRRHRRTTRRRRQHPCRPLTCVLR